MWYPDKFVFAFHLVRVWIDSIPCFALMPEVSMKSQNEIFLVDDHSSWWLCYCDYINSMFSNLSNVQVQNSHSAVHNSFICHFLPVDFLPIWMFLVKFLENSCWGFASCKKTNTQTTPFQNSTTSPLPNPGFWKPLLFIVDVLHWTKKTSHEKINIVD